MRDIQKDGCEEDHPKIRLLIVKTTGHKEMMFSLTRAPQGPNSGLCDYSAVELSSQLSCENLYIEERNLTLCMTRLTYIITNS